MRLPRTFFCQARKDAVGAGGCRRVPPLVAAVVTDDAHRGNTGLGSEKKIEVIKHGAAIAGHGQFPGPLQ